MTDEPKPFVQSAYRHRSAEGIAGFVVAVVASAALLWFVPKMEGAWKALPVGLSIMLGFGSFCLIRKIASNEVEVTRIDTGGIQQGTAFWPWTKIKHLYAEGWKGGFSVDLKMQARGEVFEIDLPIHPRLSPSQYEDLLRTLRRSVGPQFPELELGGYTMPGGGS